MDLKDKLKKLERQILTEDVSQIARTTKEWGGADVIIRSEMDERLKTWLGDDRLIINLQNIEPRRRVVITKYSKELSWLFYELRDIFSDKLDYISKYDFYGSLAQAAIDYLNNEKENKIMKNMLLTVLSTSKGAFKLMNIPWDISLPFFAYGVFKPGQLSFTRINGLARQTVKASVNGFLKERDGVPLLIKSNNLEVKGYLVYFYDGKEVEAYKRIAKIEPNKIYKWDIIKINDEIDANVLLGRRNDRGSSDLEHCEEWNGKDDPFFNQALEEVEEILKNNSSSGRDYRTLFRLQMAYTLLWSAIERYAGLKYHLGKNTCKKVFQIADEKCFADSLKKNVKNTRKVYNTTDLDKCILDPDKPRKSLEYYYQVRSNAVHRGKSVVSDFNTVRCSLEELLAIFKDMLDEAFKEEK